MTDEVLDGYDVVVVGGGAAGLNGALMLARSRRSVLVIDAGEPRNAPAEGVHGLLGHDGLPPAQLLARGRDDHGHFDVVEPPTADLPFGQSALHAESMARRQRNLMPAGAPSAPSA